MRLLSASRYTGRAVESRFSALHNRLSNSFCGGCGSPLFYERARSPHMVNISRALFASRAGREPLYHVAIEQAPDWAYAGAPLVPLKGFPGVVWQRTKKKKQPEREGMF